MPSPSLRVEVPLQDWLASGVGGHYVIKRLRDADRVLTPEALAKLHSVAQTFDGKPYEGVFEWSD